MDSVTQIKLSNIDFSVVASIINSFIFLALGGLVLLYLVSTTLYRLTLHPLAKYPGPLFGRISQWYDVYHSYGGDRHVNFYELHQKYGKIVRFSPNALSISDPAALKAIYGHGANVQKADFYHAFRAAPAAISTLLATDKAHHARKRRIMGQAFSDTAMRGLETYVLDNVRVFISRIQAGIDSAQENGQPWSEALDMSKLDNYLVFDIMGDLVFGKSFETLGDAIENRKAIHLLQRAARRNYTVAAMPFLYKSGLEKWLPPFRGLYFDRLRYLAFGKRQVMERSQDKSFGETGRRDIFSYLIHAKDPETGEGLPKPELWMEGNTLIVAGSDTSSTTMSATLYYLLRNTNCLHRLTEDVRTTFGSEDDIRMGPKLQSCTYLRACIDEAMRMSPAVPGLLPRRILPGGLHIPLLNLNLPAGVDVGTCTYAIHHLEEYVPDSFTYNPNRWLQDGKEGKQGRSRTRSDSGISLPNSGDSKPLRSVTPTGQDREALNAVFNAFGQGNRACLGKPLVYMEIGIAIARLVWKFDLRYVVTAIEDAGVKKDVKTGRRREGEYQMKDWFLSMNEGPVAEFRARP